MNTLYDWARDWGVSPVAIHDLMQRVGCFPPPPPAAMTSEAGVQSRVRLEASKRGDILWRNNVGALLDERGVPVRYGLANDSKAVNEKIKSGDCIGIHRVVITQAMVGQTLGQFDSVENKKPGWQYTGTPREVAQLAWITLVQALGGRARFCNGSDLS